jgi:hypothetical protein
MDLLRAHDRPDVGELHDQAEALRRRIDGLADDTNIPERVMARRVRALEAELADVEAKLRDVGRVDVLGDLVTADDPAAAWERHSIDRKRTVVNVLMTVVILPAGRGTRIPDFDPDDDETARRIGETLRIEWRRS